LNGIFRSSVAIVVAAVSSVLVVLPASGATKGAIVTNTCPEVSPDTCDFTFWDGSGHISPNNFVVDSYHDVITPNGKETETFHGTVPNNTGHAVLYSPGIGPVPADQTCYSFTTEKETQDWQMVISESGDYSLVCHF
jgi:hypothetical protein